MTTKNYITGRPSPSNRVIRWHSSEYECEAYYGDIRITRDGERVARPAPGLLRRAERALAELTPDFDDVRAGLAPGVYSAVRLNPPGGDDCVGLLVREDGSLTWCDPYGDPAPTTFTVGDLCGDGQMSVDE